MNSGEKLNNKVFLQLDRDFRHVMKAVERDPRVSTLINFPGLNLLLITLTGQLVHCQNTLDEYMKEKRSIFPRFFFLNDDDLLEMLGQTKITSQNRESVLQAHIKKLFPGTVGVNLGPEAVSITALKGEHGEKLTLDTPVDIDTSIEIWLSQLESQMRQSLFSCIRSCLLHYETQKDNSLHFPTQVICLVRNIQFTKNVEKAIAVRNVHLMKNELNEELNKYLKIGIRENEGDLDKFKLQTIILQCHHHLEILNELLNNHISSIDNWHWQKQLRFYIDKDSIFISIGMAKLPYTFEYFGMNSGFLVQTKLTDQCFLILTQALYMGMAGNPFGPAGTGKTESVKALGRLLGRLVLVFNCDEGMDTTTMGRLLSGLALSGAWGCFDEFNRLEEKTLSEVAQQFSSILDAIGCKAQTTSAILNGKEVQVSIGCGVFVTMNPAGGSYGGRRILPEALNCLLRPCAMWHPCAVHITSALLASNGYSNSQQFAQKLVICFDMAKSLLSDNHHYDWGLRALKTIIGSCGSNIKNAIMDAKDFPDEHKQMSLIVQAIRQNTMSKLSYDDHRRKQYIPIVIAPAKNTSSEDFKLEELTNDIVEYIGKFSAFRKYVISPPERILRCENFMIVTSGARSFVDHLNLLPQDHFHYSGRLIVVLQNEKFLKDEVDATVKEIFDRCWIVMITNVIVVTRYGDGISIFSYLPYEEKNCGKPTIIEFDRWLNNSFQNNVNVFPLKTENINICPIRVTLVSRYPQVIIKRLKNGTILFSGIEGDLIHTLARIMNFTLIASANAGDEAWGSWTGTKWTGASGDLVYGKADFGIGAYLPSISKLDIIDFSYGYDTVDLVWILPRFERNSPALKMLLPFGIRVWFLTIMTVVGLIGLIHVLHIKIDNNCCRVKDLSMSIWQITLGLPVLVMPSGKFVCFIFLVWIWTSMVLRSTYQGSLVGFLTLNLYDNSILTMRDMIEKKFSFYGTVPVLDLMEYVDDDAVKYIFKRLNVVQTYEEYDDIMANIACGKIYGTALQLRSRVTQINYNLRGKGVLNILKETYRSQMIGIAFVKYSPLLEVADSWLLKLSAVGLIDKWINDYAWPVVPAEEKLIIIQIHHVVGPFMILLFGKILSLIVFIVEILYYKYVNKKEDQQLLTLKSFTG